MKRVNKHLERIRTTTFAVYIRELLEIYLVKQVPRSAAALSYFLTLSVFPTLICIHAMIVYLLPGIELSMDELSRLIPPSSLETIRDYIEYVAAHNNKAMITAGILGMATTSAAAFRSIHMTMADIQGESRFRGIFALLFSFIFSLLFLAVIYFAAIVMVTGDWLIRFVTNVFPFLKGLELWSLIRFPLLLVIFILIIYALYRITAPRDIRKGLMVGAVAAAILIVLVSVLFSWFISMSSRYPLIYGSLASIVIFMLWMYICGQILIMGNALNVVRRRHRIIGELADDD